MFGRNAAGARTVGELLAGETGASPGGVKGLIATGESRKRIELTLVNAFTVAAFPLLLPVSLLMPLVRPRTGPILSVLARRK